MICVVYFFGDFDHSCPLLLDQLSKKKFKCGIRLGEGLLFFLQKLSQPHHSDYGPQITECAKHEIESTWDSSYDSSKIINYSNDLYYIEEDEDDV